RLTLEMVTWVDKMLACDPQHLTVPRVHRIIEETVLHYDPDRAVAHEQAALAARHVTLVHDSGPVTAPHPPAPPAGGHRACPAAADRARCRPWSRGAPACSWRSQTTTR